MNRCSGDRLPPAALRSLQRDLSLGTSPAEELRRQWGAVPSPEFVRRAWASLRDGWLQADRESRLRLVADLRARRLGDLAIDVGRAEGQKDYLRSCRNGVGLQAAVADLLVAVGTAPERSRPWTRFATALGETLATLAEGQFLVLVREDRPWFVQFAAGGPNGVRVELVSNALLDEPDRLPAGSDRAATRLGWQRPGRHGRDNWTRSWPAPVPHAAVARLAIDTLVDVLAVDRPESLRYAAFDETGATILLPGLGVPVSAADIVDPVEQRHRVVVGRLLEVLREATDDHDLTIDAEGDIPVRHGSAVVFVRVIPDPPLVRVFSPVLTEVGHDPDLFTAMNDLNVRSTMVKWHVVEGVVVASIDLFGAPVVEQHVLQACALLGDAADHLDEQLQSSFGGRTFLGDYKPPVNPPGVGGYL